VGFLNYFFFFHIHLLCLDFGANLNFQHASLSVNEGVNFVSKVAAAADNSPSLFALTAIWELTDSIVKALLAVIAGKISGALHQSVHYLVRTYGIANTKLLLPGGVQDWACISFVHQPA